MNINEYKYIYIYIIKINLFNNYKNNGKFRNINIFIIYYNNIKIFIYIILIN
jgi:hypothetical protein